ncbi:kinase-like domain-containing protein [Lentinula raphanica]|nr:kinase-like domain-containing protein [Lentinula raphanica]
MRPTCPSLSDVSEKSEEQVQDLSFSSQGSSYQERDAAAEEESPYCVPCIDTEPIDETPFSASDISHALNVYSSKYEQESFSGMFNHGVLNDTTFQSTSNYDMSYNLNRITDIQAVDSDWEDDDIDEILVISRKKMASKRMAQSLPPGNDIHSRTYHKRLLNNVFSFSEFECINSNTLDIQKTTSGTYTVKKRDTAHVYLMKAFNATTSLKWPFELRLLETLTELDCSFLPCIFRRIFEHQALFIILDSYPAGNMLNYVLQEGPLDPDEILFYSSEITEAISVLHDSKIEHRDIHPANIMIGRDGHVVLTGFESARNHGNESSLTKENQDQKSPRDCEYRAPELLLRWEHDNLVDCWGIGCLLYFMAYGKHLFPLVGIDQAQIYKQVLRGESSAVVNDGRMDSTAFDLMLQCLKRNPRLRPDVAEIKQHEYFKTIDWSEIQLKRTTAPYVPNSSCRSETPYHETAPAQSPGKPSEVDTALTQPANDQDSAKSTSSKATSVYSYHARQKVQDQLPAVFRSPSLNELNVKANQSRISDESSEQASKSVIDRVPSYESLHCSPVVTKLTREERLSLFWESLDEDVNVAPPKPARVLGISPSGNEPQIHQIGHTSRLHRQRSTIFKQTNDRLSQLLSLSTLTTQNTFRKLRRPKSTPVLTHPDIIMRRGSKNNKNKNNEYELPSGVKQIGNGIGFMYTIPAASKSKPSICTPTAASRLSHAIMPSIGVGIGLGLRTFGNGILRSKQKQEDPAGTRYGRKSQDSQSRCQDQQDMGATRMCSVQEDVVGEVEAEEQDVFRYGSTWSLLPGATGVCNCNSSSPCLDQISPVTATESTVYSPMEI